MQFLDKIDDLLEYVNKMDSSTEEETVSILKKELGDLKWIPNPGRQTDAYYSLADVLFYGGAGGGGKSDLGEGLAITAHKRSLIMRRKYADLAFLTDRTIQIVGSKKGFSGTTPPRFKFDDRLIEYGAAQFIGDELSWMGRPHDLLYVDEAAHFAKQQIRNLMGWVRSADPNQRVRVVLGSNPPLSDEGAWLVVMFAPWLDPTFANIAEPGELRWCIVNNDDEDIWVDGPGMYSTLTGEFVTHDTDVKIEGVSSAMSRTFIPAKLADNPFQDTKEYRAQQDGLPKRMRDAVRDGNFFAHRKDHNLQVIPTKWIQAAMDRWTKEPPENSKMTTIAADLTGMAEDETKTRDNFVIAKLYNYWYDKLVVIEAKDVPFGKDKAGKITSHRRDSAKIILDMGGGYGDSTYEHLKNNNIKAIKYKGTTKSLAKSKESRLKFFNKRTAIYYQFKEDLDPSQEGGSNIMLPPSNLLRADLCSIRFDKNHVDAKVLKLEPKEILAKRLGRSSDYGDPVVMANHAQKTHSSRTQFFSERMPKVIRSRRMQRHSKWPA